MTEDYDPNARTTYTSPTEITVKGYPATVILTGRWYVCKLDNGALAAQGRAEKDAINKLENKIERFDDKVKEERPTRREVDRSDSNPTDSCGDTQIDKENPPGEQNGNVRTEER